MSFYKKLRQLKAEDIDFSQVTNPRLKGIFAACVGREDDKFVFFGRGRKGHHDYTEGRTSHRDETVSSSWGSPKHVDTTKSAGRKRHRDHTDHTDIYEKKHSDIKYKEARGHRDTGAGHHDKIHKKHVDKE